MLEHPFRAPMEALCTPATWWTVRNTSREGMHILAPALRVARIVGRTPTSPPGGAG